MFQAIRASAVRKEMEAAFEEGRGVRRSGREGRGDDSAVSPGKIELQSLHRDPRGKSVGSCLFCLSSY